MLSERDRAVVFSMCRTGMSLDTLKRSFPQFSKVDVEAIYDEYSKEFYIEKPTVSLSMNCS